MLVLIKKRGITNSPFYNNDQTKRAVYKYNRGSPKLLKQRQGQ